MSKTLTLIGEAKQACDKANEIAINKIKELKPSVVIIAQQNDHDKSDWKSIIEKIKSFGVKKIIIVGAVPQWQPSLPRVMIKDKNFYSSQSRINDNGLDLKIIQDDKKAEEIVNKLNINDVRYISLITQMCDIRNSKYYCETKTPNGLLQLDYGHLSKNGSIYIVKKYIKNLI